MPTLPPNGTWFITCTAALSFKGKNHDVIFEWRRRDNIWDREAIARTPTLVNSLHEFSLHWQSDNTIAIKGKIDPDPWVLVGGPLTLTINTDQLTATGAFADSPITCSVTLRFEEGPFASRGVKTPRLQLLEDFQKQRGRGRLYDFSYAGRNTTFRPDNLPTIDALHFGLKPDSGEEALPAIQAAIDEAARRGGGIVQLPPGILDCNVHQKLPALRIKHHNIYLRGSGTGPHGTLLVNHRYSDTPDPKQPWRAGEHPLMIIAPETTPDPAPLTAITAGQRGERTIEVADPSALRIGDTYLLRQLETDGSLAADLVQHQVQVAKNWRGEGKELVSQLLTITAIDGHRITIDAPLHRSITQWPAQLCAFPMLHQVGVLDLQIRCLWGGFFIHHKNGEHDNGWDHVQLFRVNAGWVANLVHENTTSAVGLRDCLGTVIQHCRITGNPGHNGFVLCGRSTGCVFQHCHAGRNMHAFNVQGTLSGNVIADVTMDEPSGVDLHGGIGCDNLFENLVGGVNKGGGSGNAVPPRHGPGFTLWNWCTGHYDPYKPWLRSDIIADTDTMPGFIAVGVHGMYGQPMKYKTPAGLLHENLHSPLAWIESPGQRIAPRSLWHWQKNLSHS